MRKGYGFHSIENKGRLVAVGTGSEPCSEHEWGINPLLTGLCGNFGQEEAVFQGLTAAKLQAIEAGGALPFEPTTSRLITETSGIFDATDTVVMTDYDTRTDTIYERYVVAVSADSRDMLRCAQAETRNFFNKSMWCGAWCDSSFGLAAIGDKQIKQLREFVKSMRNGQVCFGGFMNQFDRKLRGLILVDLSNPLRPEYKQAMRQATLERLANNLRQKA